MSYIPARGDAVWLDFDPQAGREQAGRRPACVLSPLAYNQKSGLALICPITTKAKGYPFEVTLPPGLVIAGVILSDHLRSLDWRVRNAVFITSLPRDTVEDVLEKIAALLNIAP